MFVSEVKRVDIENDIDASIEAEDREDKTEELIYELTN
jgi:hypothetical protein